MNDALHVGGFADGRGVDLVVSEPKGRVVSLYRGNNGDIALTVEEARFLLEALPAVIARDDYLKHMGPLPDLESKPEHQTQHKDPQAPARRARAGQAWGAAEDADLLRGYNAGQGIGSLANRHGRSPKAITLRLQRLGITDPQDRIAS
jgi:hypothetical protein